MSQSPDEKKLKEFSERENSIETTKGDYRHMQTLLIGLIGLLFSLSQICSFFPEIIRNAQELHLIGQSASGWVQLFSNLTFVLSCLCSSSILALFLVGIWIAATVHVGTKKILLNVERKNWLLRFYNWVITKIPIGLRNWIESWLATLHE